MSIVRMSHPTNRPNFSQVELPKVTLWFSYETCIGFRSAEHGLVLSENLWGPTTGRHLNQISDRGRRRDRAEFETLLAEAMGEAVKV